MQDLYQLKEQSILDTPVLLFDCEFRDGRLEYWSTHGVTVGGNAYAARVLKQNVFEMQLGSEIGVDAIPQISIELGNADSHFSEIERSIGVKGGQLTVSIVFFSFPLGTATSNTQVLFKGILDPANLITEDTFRISASNRLSLQRVVFPDIRIQKRCPWDFPSSPEQRAEAVNGGSAGKYSRFYRCGYSPDIDGGAGNFAPDGDPFTTCAYTRDDCIARGMFQSDNRGRTTARYGGIEFVPASIVVRSAGEKGNHLAAVNDNQARYNDFVPMVYGTAWYFPDIVFARNDGNLTHFEVLLGVGEMNAVQKVLMNSIEIPAGVAGQNMTGTGWYNLVSAGQRNGTFNADFSDGSGKPLGDPYGSLAFLSVVVPNRINDGTSLPSIEVLVDGLRLNQYDSSMNSLGETFSNNPAWIVLDLLLRIGWQLSEIDLSSFYTTAAYCAEQIQANDLFGNAVMISRFQCNLVLSSRRAAADVLRGIRNASRLFLRYGSGGLLQLSVENSIALQQPTLTSYSNATDSLNGGWPAYEFGDGTSGTTGIARTSNGGSSVTISARRAADTSNRFVAEFQDSFNEYQQDSLSIVDSDDVAVAGQEITTTAPVLGLPHFDQAARILAFLLSKSVHGNTQLDFQTSIRALGLSPGDIIAVTYLKEGLERQPFRVTRIAPSSNYRVASITAQWHDDSWYSDTNGQTNADGSRRQGASEISLPRPISGVVLDENGTLAFGVSENVDQTPDGSVNLVATVAFSTPSATKNGGPDIPLVSLAAIVESGAGTLGGGQNLYYALTSLDASGLESGLSFVVPASLAEGSTNYSVTLTGVSLPPTAVGFQVYRGSSPSSLNQIASNQNTAGTFTDSGLPSTSILPPDPNYDHTDFYWRVELEPPVNATAFSLFTIGSSTLELIPNSYEGMIVRIISGSGKGQERVVATNTDQLLSVTSSWDVLPDFTSTFVVAQGTFQFGAVTRSSPAQLTIPNQAGNVVQISGRSANCNGLECPYEISPLTRYTIGGAGIVNVDSDVPAAPTFGLSVPDDIGGTVVFGALAFPDLSNLSTISAGTYRLSYLDELKSSPLANLSAEVDASSTQISLDSSVGSNVPALFILDSEVLQAVSADLQGSVITVVRGVLGSSRAAHGLQTPLQAVQQAVYIVPFAKRFFGSPASGDWNYPISLPNVRIVAAELFVTNSQGNSATSVVNFGNLLDGGLRTFSGGQFSFAVSGFLAVQANASADILVDAPRIVRDVYAVVKQAPQGASLDIAIRLNGNSYCELSIPDGSTVCQSEIDGASLSPMHYQDRLSLDIKGVGRDTPGSDLTVIIRI